MGLPIHTGGGGFAIKAVLERIRRRDRGWRRLYPQRSLRGRRQSSARLDDHPSRVRARQAARLLLQPRAPVRYRRRRGRDLQRRRDGDFPRRHPPAGAAPDRGRQAAARSVAACCCSIRAAPTCSTAIFARWWARPRSARSASAKRWRTCRRGDGASSISHGILDHAERLMRDELTQLDAGTSTKARTRATTTASGRPISACACASRCPSNGIARRLHRQLAADPRLQELLAREHAFVGLSRGPRVSGAAVCRRTTARFGPITVRGAGGNDRQCAAARADDDEYGLSRDQHRSCLLEGAGACDPPRACAGWGKALHCVTSGPTPRKGHLRHVSLARTAGGRRRPGPRRLSHDGHGADAVRTEAGECRGLRAALSRAHPQIRNAMRCSRGRRISRRHRHRLCGRRASRG